MDRFNIPPTVSPEAFLALEAAYANIKPLLGMRAPTTQQEWDALSAAVERFQHRSSANFADRLGVSVTDGEIGDIPVLRICPPRQKAGKPVLVYIHGGGYVFFSARSSLTVPVLASIIGGCEVLSIDYTLAPAANWVAATDEVLAFWRGLLASGIDAGQVAIFGDSAGGALAAGAVLKMRDESLPLPGALYLISPWADITPNGDTVETLAAADPTLSIDLLDAGAIKYAAKSDQAHPYVSPVHGDYDAAFPPTIIQAGTREIFLSHAVRLYQKIKAGGKIAVLDVYEGMPHVWQALIPDTPEARISIERAIEFIHAHIRLHDR